MNETIEIKPIGVVSSPVKEAVDENWVNVISMVVLLQEYDAHERSAYSGTQVPFHLTRWIHIQRDPVLEINPECDALMHRMSTKSRIKA
ncbi:MAG: hypothetical protein ACOY90_19765, partial [Candidatus Zhuqueibacterota bacterium]